MSFASVNSCLVVFSKVNVQLIRIRDIMMLAMCVSKHAMCVVQVEVYTKTSDDDCFYYHSWRNNVVIAFGTLSSFLT